MVERWKENGIFFNLLIYFFLILIFSTLCELFMDFHVVKMIRFLFQMTNTVEIFGWVKEKIDAYNLV